MASVHSLEFLVVNEFGHIISACEATDQFFLMFIDALEQIAGYASIENTIVFIGRDVETRAKFTFLFPL